MKTDELEHICRMATAIAQEAGRLLLEGWGTRPSSKMKSALSDIVTEYDGRAEELVTRRLVESFPQHAVIAEEGTRLGGDEGGDDRLTWYVDPLDGTMNFAHGLPIFAVSLGLARGREPLVGVVEVPALGWTFAGVAGAFATRNGHPISVSATDVFAHGLFATGFPHVPGQPDANLPEFSAFLNQTHGVRRLGSAAIDLCGVAAGWFDAYWERHIKPWDLVGGAAIVLGAGGQVSDPSGAPYDSRTGNIVATNGRLHDATLRVLGEVAGRSPPT